MQTGNDTYSTIDTFTELLLHLNRSLSSYRHFPKNIKQALKSAGIFTGHDRVHILEIRDDMTYDIVYEWYAKESGPTPDKWKHAGIFCQPTLENQLCAQNYILIRDEASADSDISTLLKEQDCRQMLLLPLFESGAHLAFISFLQCRHIHDCSAEEIRTLCQLASVIATHLNNYTQTHRLLLHLKKYHEQNISFLLQYNRLKNIRSELASVRHNIKKKKTDFPEWTEIELHLSQLDKICQSLIEK